MNNLAILQSSVKINVRFSEVDSMGVVWHGAYPIYFEDAREKFGAEHGLGYMDYFNNKCFAPIVELNIQYKKPIRYGMKPVVEITYRPTDAAKVVFDYTIYDADGTVCATAHSVQVFMDMDYNLMWDAPDFYREWKILNRQV